MKRKLMENNSININKTHNHLSSHITEHKMTTTYGVGNPGPGLGQTHKGGGIKQVNEITSLFW
jgi:hypothetical protein